MHWCKVHCPGGGGGFAAVTVLGVAVGVLVVARVAALVASLAVVFALAVFAACVASVVVLVWVLKFGALRMPARAAVVRPARVRAMRALPAPPLAIEPPAHVVAAAKAIIVDKEVHRVQ